MSRQGLELAEGPGHRRCHRRGVSRRGEPPSAVPAPPPTPTRAIKSPSPPRDKSPKTSTSLSLLPLLPPPRPSAGITHEPYSFAAPPCIPPPWLLPPSLGVRRVSRLRPVHPPLKPPIPPSPLDMSEMSHHPVSQVLPPLLSPVPAIPPPPWLLAPSTQSKPLAPLAGPPLLYGAELDPLPLTRRAPRRIPSSPEQPALPGTGGYSSSGKSTRAAQAETTARIPEDGTASRSRTSSDIISRPTQPAPDLSEISCTPVVTNLYRPIRARPVPRSTYRTQPYPTSSSSAPRRIALTADASFVRLTGPFSSAVTELHSGALLRPGESRPHTLHTTHLAFPPNSSAPAVRGDSEGRPTVR